MMMMRRFGKSLTAVVGAFGALVLVGFHDEADTAVSTGDDLAIGGETEKSGDRCSSPLSVDYLESLESGENSDARFPGCGGLL